MAVQLATTIGNRHVLGDLVSRVYVLGTVADGDTLVVPQTRIESVIVVPTTNVAIGTTWADNTPTTNQATLTFHGGPWTGRIQVLSRVG